MKYSPKALIKNIIVGLVLGALTVSTAFSFIGNHRNNEKIQDLESENIALVETVDSLKDNVESLLQNEVLNSLEVVEAQILNKDNFSKEDRADIMKKLKALEYKITSLCDDQTITEQQALVIFEEIIQVEHMFLNKNITSEILALCESQDAVVFDAIGANSENRTQTYLDKDGMIVVHGDAVKIVENGKTLVGEGTQLSGGLDVYGFQNLNDFTKSLKEREGNFVLAPVIYDEESDTLKVQGHESLQYFYTFSEGSFVSGQLNTKCGDVLDATISPISQEEYDELENQYKAELGILEEAELLNE